MSGGQAKVGICNPNQPKRPRYGAGSELIQFLRASSARTSDTRMRWSPPLESKAKYVSANTFHARRIDDHVQQGRWVTAIALCEAVSAIPGDSFRARLRVQTL